MTQRGLFVLGLALILGGLARIWLHITSASLLAIPTCLGNTVQVPVEGPLWQTMHCWGCYALPAGVLLVLAAPMRRVLRARS